MRGTKSSLIKQFAARFNCLKDILIVNNENGMTKMLSLVHDI
jgi:hypothetical protein